MEPIQKIKEIDLTRCGKDIDPYIFDCLFGELRKLGLPKQFKNILRRYIECNLSLEGKDVFNKGYYHNILFIEEIFRALKRGRSLPWVENGGLYAPSEPKDYEKILFITR